MQRFEEVLVAIRRSVVLWIEDLERFAGAENLPPGDVGNPGNDRLAPIRSLLHLLDRKKGLSVILASTSLDARFDMDKLARFVERVPRLDPRQATELIEFFRRGCLDLLGDRIDPAEHRRKERQGGPGPEDDELTPAMLFPDLWPGPQTLTESIAHLCRTPRRLKSSLRAALDVWEPLAGEIDLDDVLLMSVVKVAEPDVFALVEQHIDFLRRGPGRGEDGKDEKSPFEKGLHQLLSPGSERRRAVSMILNYVFPRRASASEGYSLPKRPQGLSVDHGADYWSRYLSVPDLEDDERDQPILKAIKLWEDDRTGRLPEFVADERRSGRVENFGGLLSSRALNDLLGAMIESRSDEPQAEWPDDELGYPIPPGIVPLWRIMLRRPVDKDALEALLDEAIQTVAGKKLAVASAIMPLFATSEEGVPHLLDSDAVIRVRRTLHDALKKLDPTEMIETLRGAYPWVLLHCSWGLDRIRRKDLTGLPFEGWTGFAARLLDALDRQPLVVLPQILPFIVSAGDPLSERPPTFDGEMARRLFDFDRLVGLVEGHRPDVSAMPEAIRERYEVLLRWIDAHHEAPS